MAFAAKDLVALPQLGLALQYVQLQVLQDAGFEAICFVGMLLDT